MTRTLLTACKSIAYGVFWYVLGTRKARNHQVSGRVGTRESVSGRGYAGDAEVIDVEHGLVAVATGVLFLLAVAWGARTPAHDCNRFIAASTCRSKNGPRLAAAN